MPRTEFKKDSYRDAFVRAKVTVVEEQTRYVNDVPLTPPIDAGEAGVDDSYRHPFFREDVFVAASPGPFDDSVPINGQVIDYIQLQIIPEPTAYPDGGTSDVPYNGTIV